MNKSFLMIMGGALVVAVMVALVVQSKISPKTSKVSLSTEVLVANKKLLTGEKLKAEDVHWQAWPDNAQYKGIIKKSEQPAGGKLAVYGTPLRRNIEAGEPVTMQALIPDVKGGGNFLAASIEPGMRAMALAVKPQTIAGGFITPGDYVDVVLTYATKISTEEQKYAGSLVQKFASQTILSNVRVLAVDQSAKEDVREAKIGKTVTLEVTRQGSEILALAVKMGDITLALRHLGEQDSPDNMPPAITTDATTSNVLQQLNEMKNSSNIVRMYSGTSVQNVPVRAPTSP